MVHACCVDVMNCWMMGISACVQSRVCAWVGLIQRILLCMIAFGVSWLFILQRNGVSLMDGPGCGYVWFTVVSFAVIEMLMFSSSLISRMMAFVGDSLCSILPPGSSHFPG